ncbi:MAG: T9SS type A sorting domain-containing protein, partial [Bacteroidota bacterium]|nr:T9SS type A sorting domain-containing protein [Bacteroidota bacterium]
NGVKTWDKTIGGTDYENLRSVQQTSSGTFVIAGTSSSAVGADKSVVSKGETDFWLVNIATGKEQPPVVNQQVDSFTLVNADTEQDIQTLTNGSTLNLATLPTRNLNIRANTSTTALDSVVLDLSGADTLHLAELNAPYILFGAVGTNYNAWTPALGNYTLAGTTYTTTSDSDTVGTPLVVSFTVIDQPGTTIDTAPIANAGSDITITLPTNTVTLNGTGTDAQGPIKQFIWNQVSGPSASKISSTLVANPVVTGLVEGTYVYSLVVTDSKGQVSPVDFVNVIVTSTTINTAPLANAGSDVTITLPTNSVTLNGTGTDKEGAIKQYIWNQVSGPSASKISNTLIANPVVSGLAAGTYVYSLVVTDAQDAVSAADFVSVNVNNNTTVTTGSQITSLTLINGDTDKDILTITEGTVLNLATLPTKNLNIRINTVATGVGSVKLALSGRWTINKIESAPYTLFGDEKNSNGTINYGGIALPTGDYTLKSTPYSGSNGSGTAGTALTVNFKIINQAAAATINDSTSIASANKVTEASTGKATVFTNFPNPFQDQTTIQFTFAQEEEYKVEVYNMSGELVSQLKSGKAAAGETIQTIWDASQTKNGIYLIKLTTKNKVKHLRVMHSK